MTVDYSELVNNQRLHYLSGATQDVEGRKERLRRFRVLLEKHRGELEGAIYADLHRHSDENYSEVTSGLKMIDEALENIDEWTKPQPVAIDSDSSLKPAEDALFIVPEPLGVVLVLGPWNYPLVCILPLLQAVAAGNTIIVKPSEICENFSRTFTKAVTEHFDQKEIAAIEGGVPETTQLLKERFDHILYTGCPPVAKIIMAAAARHLTPVTLELGGKNPVLVDESADLSLLTQSIVVAKLSNAGQICISADYIITTPEMKEKVVSAIRAGFDKLGNLVDVKEFARIVSERHFARLQNLLDNTKGKIVYKAQGELDETSRFMPFHLIDVDHDDIFMQSEVFGPLLPIITVPTYDAALEYIKIHEKPLSAYLFTQNGEHARRFLRETSSGGATVNGIMSHNQFKMPFGGVGNSGMGRVHSKYAFDRFTHEKAVAVRAGIKDSLHL